MKTGSPAPLVAVRIASDIALSSMGAILDSGPCFPLFLQISMLTTTPKKGQLKKYRTIDSMQVSSCHVKQKTSSKHTSNTEDHYARFRRSWIDALNSATLLEICVERLISCRTALWAWENWNFERGTHIQPHWKFAAPCQHRSFR